MTCTKTLPVLFAIALAAPIASANAQGNGPPCGPETWSTENMTYAKVPCTGGEAASPDARAKTYRSPTPNTAYTPPTEPAFDPRAVFITDEYGFKYNARGDRIR